ncbi:hypothetical protein CC1G_14932 [Coprinopsis cinerea okayama7|uniref:Uncharacterized protein n=1 Tax=Coprinopsis cinerea (strain Okayama-7 / 130 / ATCC MYA-4618 / FGSC 9003) TaxID=240176 RepID=D6RPB4_COPC7|nr:hypothetical protein CC1G_14932 [Coprinopsis cinerea okayama7\|eukprot:XP_002910601.1 hypothetical protein CC1G_14932 [Coprinopsis cinerea okayama7\
MRLHQRCFQVTTTSFINDPWRPSKQRTTLHQATNVPHHLPGTSTFIQASTKEDAFGAGHRTHQGSDMMLGTQSNEEQARAAIFVKSVPDYLNLGTT